MMIYSSANILKRLMIMAVLIIVVIIMVVMIIFNGEVMKLRDLLPLPASTR